VTTAGGEGRSERRRSELATRVLSALVLVPLALAAAYFGGWLWALFWLIAAVGVLWEWVTLAIPAASRRLSIAGGVAYGVAALLIGVGAPQWGLAVLALAAVVLAALAPVGQRLWAAAGALYGAVLLVAPVMLRADAAFGLLAVVFLFGVVWASDIAAYFAGRAIGGPKLWARVSPKKTVSGAIGGTLAAILVALAVAYWGGVRASLALIAVALALSVVSQGGDLLESAIKRRFGAKDASQLIPGHGGLMDRLDGFITAAALAALIGVSRGGVAEPARGLLIW
jgi:phosphatidate cytidylyltransferase